MCHTPKSALFLDRDGVINQRIVGGYVKNINEFILLPHVAEVLAKLKPLFARIIVVTNQQGVGKGLMTEADLAIIHTEMLKKLPMIDRVYHCSALATQHHPDRKPAIGMALRAAADFPEISLADSLMIGDTESDILFGKRAGMRTILFGNETITSEIKPDFFAENWQQIAELFANIMEK
ncbi:MAG: HAD-IIIA family hydrolase [Cytophagales bacterium]|nr:HAD-IIIA family hydrolase [Bernardetiaceae bacterium]MDW8205696.1 HAD-IIIA family hydrolase [Cytophagales bacterium]